jgi:hypothetical protein
MQFAEVPHWRRAKSTPHVDPATHNENGQLAKANTRCTFLEAQRQCLQPQLNDDAELTITKAKERREKKKQRFYRHDGTLYTNEYVASFSDVNAGRIKNRAERQQEQGEALGISSRMFPLSRLSWHDDKVSSPSKC